MHVSGILKTKDGSAIISAKPDDTIETVVALLAAHRIGAVLALEPDGGVAGIISERDIVRGLATHGPAVLNQHVSDLMTRKVLGCAPDDSVSSIMTRMTEGRFRHMPVIDKGKLVGFISIGDVVKFRLAEATHEVESMRVYVAGGF
ncbi:CBS domain-containing protein [Nitrospirillum iridis]|uniref:CBS domain-containing protein n=1 Tax=Nitrospirillum iridis TaxID=765888 RepID=A0A7X0EFA2_9PROT|nr:CBS domain-containing protein [Nitrospirillum iridis]MBB6254743.1 CBS domain-containing protein [Nitrospirillum iridis]